MTADILGSYWTTAGPVEIHSGREWSLFSWPERCAEAARTGMAGLGLWHADLAHLLERHSLAELRQIAADHGQRVLEVEFLGDWFLEEGSPGRLASDGTRKLLFDAAAELGVHHIKVGNLAGTPCARSRVTDQFGQVCADAAQRTPAPLAYELMPFDVNAPTLEAALEVVGGADAPNGGLALDFWHLGKLRLAPAGLRAIPARYLTYVELSDGMRADMPDHVEETTSFRRLPGEGEFDVRGYVSVLTDMGYRGPWGVEVLSAELRALPISDMFDRAARSVRISLEEAPQ